MPTSTSSRLLIPRALAAALLLLCLLTLLPACGRSPAPAPPPPPGPPGAAAQYRDAWAKVDVETRIAVSDFTHTSLSDEHPLAIDPAGAAHLEALSEYIDGVITAAAEPVCDFEVDNTLGVEGATPHLPYMRFTARVLVMDAYRLAAAGETDAAAARLLALLRSANHLRSDRRLFSSRQAVALATMAVTHAERLLDDPAKLSPETRAGFAAAIDNLLDEDPFGAKAALRHERSVHLTYGYSSESLNPREFTANDRRGGGAFYDTVLKMWDAPYAENLITELSLEALMERHKTVPSRDKHGPIAREALGGSHKLPTLIREIAPRLIALKHTLNPRDSATPAPSPD